MERLTSIIDYDVEVITNEKAENKCNNIRSIILIKLDEILKDVMHKINNNINPNICLFIYNFQLFIFNNYSKIDQTSFDILYKYINSKEIIVYIDNLYIEEIKDIDYLYLCKSDFKPNVKYIKVTDLRELNLLPKDITGLRINFLEIENGLFLEETFKNLKYIDISSNKINKFTYTHKSLKELYVNDINGLTEVIVNENLELINISDTSLNIINKTIFSTGSHHRDIIVIEEPLDSLKSLITNFKTIVVNNTSSISKNLDHLKISSYHEINDDLKNLKSLEFYSDGIVQFNCPNLESLCLSFIHRDMLEFSQNLISLKLYSLGNDITITSDCINLPNLKYLHIDNFGPNEILSQVPFIFPKLDLIELVLHVKNNYEYHEDMFSLLTSLEKLSLTNGIFPSKIFKNLIKLKDLSILSIYNRIIDSDIFNDLINLTSLSFSSYFLNSLPQDIFKNLTKLEKIEISLDDYNDISENIFNTLDNLKDLNMQFFPDMNISKLFYDVPLIDRLEYVTYDLKHNFVFSNLNNLRTLILAITYYDVEISINEHIFDDLPNLVTLKIYTDGVKFPTNVFKKLSKLKKLVIRGMCNINKEMFKEFKTLEYINIYECDDCEIDVEHNNPNLRYFKYNRYRII